MKTGTHKDDDNYGISITPNYKERLKDLIQTLKKSPHSSTQGAVILLERLQEVLSTAFNGEGLAKELIGHIKNNGDNHKNAFVGFYINNRSSGFFEQSGLEPVFGKLQRTNDWFECLDPEQLVLDIELARFKQNAMDELTLALGAALTELCEKIDNPHQVGEWAWSEETFTYSSYKDSHVAAGLTAATTILLKILNNNAASFVEKQQAIEKYEAAYKELLKNSPKLKAFCEAVLMVLLGAAGAVLGIPGGFFWGLKEIFLTPQMWLISPCASLAYIGMGLYQGACCGRDVAKYLLGLCPQDSVTDRLLFRAPPLIRAAANVAEKAKAIIDPQLPTQTQKMWNYFQQKNKRPATKVVSFSRETEERRGVLARKM